jgi:hypothetical protein
MYTSLNSSASEMLQTKTQLVVYVGRQKIMFHHLRLGCWAFN